jgi:diadenosine tetraphosphatase ApaH/serine/threonine PP2A family protein phosphatase
MHGSLHDTDQYILTANDVREQFRALRELSPPVRIGFFGHTHVKVAFTLLDGAILVEQNENIRLADERFYLVNPGSVGQPRDGDPRAAFAVYDPDKREISFHRAEYDINACQDKIIRAGLPPRLAERLAIGR